MAYQVQVEPEDKDKAVKTRPVLEGVEEVEVEVNPKEVKICPLLTASCLKEKCEWYVEVGVVKGCAIKITAAQMLLMSLRSGAKVE